MSGQGKNDNSSPFCHPYTKAKCGEYAGRYVKSHLLLECNPSIKEEMVKNYRKMRVLLIDCKWYPVCPMKKFYEKGKLSKGWVELYCKGDWESCIRYQMEERGELHPDWMLPDGSIDERLHNFYKEMVR